MVHKINLDSLCWVLTPSSRTVCTMGRNHFWSSILILWNSFVFTKGQLISKCLFGVFNFLQKTNENKSDSSKIEFVCSFFGGNVSLKKIILILSDLYFILFVSSGRIGRIFFLKIKKKLNVSLNRNGFTPLWCG